MLIVAALLAAITGLFAFATGVVFALEERDLVFEGLIVCAIGFALFITTLVLA